MSHSPEPGRYSGQRDHISDAVWGIAWGPQRLSSRLTGATSSEASGEEALREPGGFSAATRTILLVEDDDMLRSAVARMLRKQHCVVLEAADGCAAVEMFRTEGNGIDIVLLDVALPGIPGPRVLEELRSLRRDVRVIFSSAYSREMALRNVPDGQLYDFIRKPYRIAELLDLLQKS